MNDIGSLLLTIVLLFAGIQLILWVYNYGFDAAIQKIKLENQQPLVGLKKFGFVADSDSGQQLAASKAAASARCTGCIDGFSAEILIECKPASFWREQPHYIVWVYFDSDSSSAADSDVPAPQSKAHSNFFKWQDGVSLYADCAERKVAIGRFSKPDSQQLFAAAKELAIELKKLGINPDAASQVIN